MPHWDLACEARYRGHERAMVLVEAKAHREEFLNENWSTKAKEPNRSAITKAILEARDGLRKFTAEVAISPEAWYQFSNRVAFAWKLAEEGVPTVLIYLGFTGDGAINRTWFATARDWYETMALTNAVVPRGLWEKKLQVGGTPLWLLIRSRRCIRLSPDLDWRRNNKPKGLSFLA